MNHVIMVNKLTSPSSTSLCNAEITSMCYGPHGITKISGKTYFIENGLVGDRVEAKPTSEKNRYGFGSVQKIIEPSVHRRKSPCSHSRECGNCPWIELNSGEKQTWKTRVVRDSIERIAGLSLEEDLSCSTNESESYRNRVLLRGRLKEDGSVSIGFFKGSSHQLTEIQSCSIASTRINNFIKDLLMIKVNKPEGPLKFRLNIQEVQPQANRSLVITLHGISKTPKKDFLDLVKKISSSREVVWCGFSNSTQTRQARFLWDQQFGLDFYTAPEQFQQTSHYMNHKLRLFVMEMMKKVIAQDHRILDLYSGSGNLSLPIAKKYPMAKLTCVEQDPRAIEIGRFNAHKNELTNINFIQSRCETYVHKLIEKQYEIDFLLIDPPRAGMKGILDSVLDLNPKKILYVSCNPTTLARDLAQLKGSYEIETITTFDFFPDTYHIETVVLLKNLGI